MRLLLDENTADEDFFGFGVASPTVDTLIFQLYRHGQ